MSDNVTIKDGYNTEVPIAADNVSGVQFQIVKIDMGGNGISNPVSASANAIPVKTLDDVIKIICTLNTSVYADGDVLFDTQEIPNCVNLIGDTCILQSIGVIDTDDQGQGFDLIFLDSGVSLGSENSAPNINDTNIESFIGRVQIGSGSYYDLGVNKIASLYGIGLLLKSGSSTSLYVGGISRGTGTYSASGIQLKFGFLRG